MMHLDSKRKVNRSLFRILLLLLMAASITAVACRTSTTTSDEVGLVWETWGHIKSSYVGADALDSQDITGNMILKMLDASDKPSYPFLTELEGVRGRVPGDVPRELTDVWKGWTLFREKWPEVNPELLAGAAIEGMLESLGDKFLEHLNPESYERAQESLRGTYEGIGAFVSIAEDGRIILSPMTDSPAERAGLQAGDLMVAVDGESVQEKSVQEVVDQVRGPAGTKVTLVLDRPGEDEPLELAVVRGAILMKSVERRLLPGSIGYLYISDFKVNTPEEVLDELELMSRLDTLALILDLRSNPGGLIDSAQKVASEFIQGGLFMYEVDKEGVRKDWPIEDGGIATEELPMVVIVNQFTASAAEAVAGALQDSGRAVIIGARTTGKGSASEFKTLSDGSAVYLPVSHWYTRSGNLIQGEGVIPDIESILTAEDRSSGIDSQLADAFNYLDDLLPSFR